MFFRRPNPKRLSAERRACDLIRRSDLFDSDWYLERYPDVAEAQFDPALHYLRHGAGEGRNPGPWFDTKNYLEALNGELGEQNPLLHYLSHRADVVLTAQQGKKRTYSNFSEFLKFTATNPIIDAPFNEEDRRCFAVMEAIGRFLIKSTWGDECVKISVVMPVRNRAETLLSAITSVLTQNYKNFELIVIDDASEDGSGQIADQAALHDPRIKVHKFEHHVGVCMARNYGLTLASGDIIAYLDSDNSWLNDYLSAAVGAFSLLPDADAIYGAQYIYGDVDVNKVSAVRFGPMNVSLLTQHNYIDLNCFLHRRHIIDTGFRFDVNLNRLVDWDFILKINERFNIVSVPTLYCKYYLHAAANTITKTVPLDASFNKIAHKTGQASTHRVTGGFTRKVCVVIPSYQALDHLKKCICSLHPYKDNEMLEIVIVDNNSDLEVKDYLRTLAGEQIKVIFNDVNYGFSYSVNQAVATASAEADIVLLNNDARLEDSSLEILQGVAYGAADIAMTVPQQICPPESVDISAHVPYATLGLPCDVTLSSHHQNIDSIELFHNGNQVELNFAPFFCVYIKRAVWDLCGGLDYKNGRHYRSDRIMCDYIKLVLRKRIVYTPAAKVHHAVQVSTKELRAESNAATDEYRAMLINNIWPSELMDELDIERRPWQTN